MGHQPKWGASTVRLKLLSLAAPFAVVPALLVFHSCRGPDGPKPAAPPLAPVVYTNDQIRAATMELWDADAALKADECSGNPDAIARARARREAASHELRLMRRRAMGLPDVGGEVTPPAPSSGGAGRPGTPASPPGPPAR
jgi:hypothetical protein